MEPWQQELQKAISTPAELAAHLPLKVPELEAICARYPLRLTRHLLSLIEGPDDPLWRQFIPDRVELQNDNACLADPLAEAEFSPLPGVVHRHPDRALLLVNGSCAAYCRFCFRKGRVGTGELKTSFAELEAACDYFSSQQQLREVILTGGEPLLLGDRLLASLLQRLRGIEQVQLLRIHSRLPVVLPSRISEPLVRLLQQHQPLYLVLHLNHPRELAPPLLKGIARLADAGIPLASQTVLLQGVNDSADTLEELFRSLLRLRVRPYYLHQGDLTRGTSHFRTPLASSRDLLAELRRRLPGIGVPQLVVDLPGGRGKIPLHPDQDLQPDAEGMVGLKTPDGKPVAYPDKPPSDSTGTAPDPEEQRSLF